MKLHIKPETMCKIIAKTREFQAKEAVVLPDDPDSPTEDWALQTLADRGEDDSTGALLDSVSGMSERQRAELVALLWLGRGDYSLEEWEKAVDDAIGEYSLRAGNYVLAHPEAPDYLEEGFRAFGYSCDD